VKTHGQTHTPIYNSWASLIARCENAKDARYHRYGGRGIKVCAKWRNDFAAFARDVGERPPGTSIDRIDNDGDYEPGNCRWATPTEQANNTSRSIVIAGRTLREWSELTGLKLGTIQSRVHRGWSRERAVRP